MLKSIMNVTALFAILIALSGCSKPGSEYIGNWIGSTKSPWTGDTIIYSMNIDRNGDNFIINITSKYIDIRNKINDKPAPFSEEKTPDKYHGKFLDRNKETLAATLKDGQLTADQTTNYTFIKADGTILGPSKIIFKKDTPEHSQDIKNDAIAEFKKKYPSLEVQKQ